MEADIILSNNPGYEGMASMVEGLAYRCEGLEHPITLVRPNRPEGSAQGSPLVVFLQGSGWTSPNRYYQLPQLCSYARRGLAVAAITHRDATEGHPFPGYLKDAKAAIRFLRSQAGELGLDPDRVAFFGTSSGGNTALLVGLTGDDSRYRSDDYADCSDAVRAVVDCFGPTDLLDYEGAPLPGLLGGGPESLAALKAQAQAEGNEMLQILLALFGDANPLTVLRAMSPLYEVRDGEACPPTLIVQGDSDQVVPLSQSLRMHRRLQEAGADSTLAVIRGAEHEGSFWSVEAHRLIFEFLKTHLGF